MPGKKFPGKRGIKLRTSSIFFRSSYVALAASVVTAPAYAQEQKTSFRLDIPSQDMGLALNALAKITKSQVIFNSDVVRGKRSNSLHGSYSADEALEILTRDSGLSTRKSARGVFVIDAAQKVSGLGTGGLVEAEQETPIIVVTGSRIRRTDTATDQPITRVSSEDLQARGYGNVAYTLNDMPIAGLQESPRGDQGANVGRNYANLLNLGSARTLTLVNGRRFVTSNPGTPGTRSPGSQVDLNNIPAGLVERVEIIPATGAATYGSGAIAGVLNIILKNDFSGIEIDGQTGITSRGDRPTYNGRLILGQGFADGRGHFVISGEYSKQGGLLVTDRPSLGKGYTFAPNPANTDPNDGIPASILVSDWRIPELTYGGLPFVDSSPFISSIATLPDPANPGSRVPAQFAPGGTLVPYDPGTYYTFALASGGQGLPLAATFALESPVERKLLYAIGSYELSDQWKLSTELSGAWVRARETRDQGSAFSSALFGGPRSAFGPVPIDISNPFLSAQARSILSAQGITTFYLNRYSDDLLAAGGGAVVKTDTQRAVLALDGDFNIGDRNFYLSANVNWGHTGGSYVSTDIIQQNFLYAVDAVQNGNTISCRVTVQNPGSTDPAISGCQPLNLFGAGAPSVAAIDYVVGKFRRDADIYMLDSQFNLGGELVQLPAGMLRFSAGAEYRREKSDYKPDSNTMSGTGRVTFEERIAGSYSAKELYGEVSIPVVGKDFTLPMIYSFDLDAAGRYVDHSLAGSDTSWNFGGRLRIIPDIMLRGSKSRTFRSPSALELFLPTSQGFSGRVTDPCDYRNIGGGNNPSARTANCQALFASLGLPANYQLISTAQVNSVPITVGGNLDLQNEIAESTTFGFVLEPRFIPGFSLSVDWIKIHLKDGITNFRINSILSTCFDAPNPDSAICGLVQRDPMAQITFAKTGYVNAAYTDFKSINISANYRIDLDNLGVTRSGGALQIGLDIVNTRKLATSVSGLGYDLNESAGEVSTPKWKGQLRLNYTNGPLSVFWSSQYVSSVKYDLLLTNEDQNVLGLPSYTKHDLSLQLEATDRFRFRAGVNNIFDKLPPYPAGANGADFGAYDVLGRNFFVGVTAKL
tara:strand:- start:106006 stop:109305 length:3300 start_codon:yes stop_codon:yes gene_type:complete